MDSDQFIVHKFGGGSLLGPSSYLACYQHLTNEPSVVVISASHGTTEKLQRCLERAKQQENFQTCLDEIIEQNCSWVDECFGKSPEIIHLMKCKIREDGKNIHDALHAIQLIGDYSSQARDLVLSYGERWSAKILTAVISQHRPAIYLDAYDILHTIEKRRQIWIDWEKSETAWKNTLAQSSVDCFVMTGFIARSEANLRITLGLNGSDYSATAMAKITKAKKCIIWKDVEGIYTADPRRVRSAFPIKELSYESALELAYFGASVLHPRAITPVMNEDIPINIRHFDKPELTGTLICREPSLNSHAVQGLTSIDHVSIITIEGSGMIGVSGTASRVFSRLHHENISVILISQASSEHSICFTVVNNDSAAAVKALREEFEFELQCHLIEKIKSDDDCAILAVVGDGMVGTKGIAGKLCSTLAKANVNIRAIAQGSSERNISVVVNQSDIHKGLRAVHAGFYLSEKTISVGLIGPGTVGETLLAQIQQESQSLREHYQIHIQVRGIANSKKMLREHGGIHLENWQEELEAETTAVDLEQFCEFIHSDDVPHAVIIDCTANQTVADHYALFIQQGAHIITPNKRAGSGDIDNYLALRKLCKEKNRYFFYETTVCAGLPVMTTIQDLLATGDEITEIRGIVSGTLSYIFYQLRQGKRFSEIIKEARDNGYTEPDPRDDLSGMDVARKVVILAREMGCHVTLSQVQVENLVPEALQDCNVEEFMQRLSEFDDDIHEYLASITKEDEICAYVGYVNHQGELQVGISAYPQSHPFATIHGTDNMLILHTRRYHENPLVIQGPGAGAEVTAAGVFADLLRCANLIA